MRAIDTNVLVRFVVGDDAVMTAKTLRLLEEADEAGEPRVIPNPVLLEALWVLGSVYRFSRDDILDAFERLLALRAVRFESHELLRALVQRGRASTFDLADLLIGLHVRSLGCVTTLTFDKKAAQSDLFEELV